MSASASGPWEQFADAVLQREALLCRVGRGMPPRDFAGLVVDDQEVDRILRQLPGLDGPGLDDTEWLISRVQPEVERARARLHADVDADPLFAGLASSARLTAPDIEVLALLAAVETDPSRQRLVMYCQDSVNLPRLTLSGLRRLFPRPHLGTRAVAATSRLARGQLIHVADGDPWAVRMVGLASRVAWHLAGDASPDNGLPVGAWRLEANSDTARPSVDDSTALGHAGGAVLVCSGGDHGARRDAIRAARPHSAWLVVPLPTTVDEWNATVREATITGCGVVVELDIDLPVLARARMAQADHLCWALSSPTEQPLECLPDRPWQELRGVREPVTEQEWDAAVGQVHAGHRLTQEQLGLVRRAVHATGGDVEASIRRLASGHLDGLARRITPRRSWPDLVLAPEEKEQLAELVSRYRHRGTVYDRWGFAPLPSAGIVALFAGPSGTGKTLAAEVVAHALGLDLYKIDLSAIVSKWIGETEKNLERIFASAAAGNLVLFFDEADALFGKRSDVSDAHDRYANIEVSYLLQRLEAYDGLVVLATNLQGNIDPAFLRRIHISVEFAVPGTVERRAIWEGAFPATAPLADIDFDALAGQFKVTGGAIRNAALAAAFMAAEAGEPVSTLWVVRGLRREFQKLGRLRTGSEFDRYLALVDDEAVTG